jgi:hypothetical protein
VNLNVNGKSNPINIIDRSISHLLHLTDSFFLLFIVTPTCPFFVVAPHLPWKLAICQTLPRNIEHIATIVFISLLLRSLFVSPLPRFLVFLSFFALAHRLVFILVILFVVMSEDASS